MKLTNVGGFFGSGHPKTEMFMKLVKFLGTALVALSFSAPSFAQQAAGGQPDQVDQLAQMVGLSDDQQTEIRGILDEMQGKIGQLRQEAQQIQQQMQAEIKADYDEAAIRENAEELGDLTGEIAALSTLMQAKVDSVFTQEQRDELDKRMQQMQQQMQQQRQMMQQQQQQGQ
ncbi:hypothetical protein SAMN04487961_2875 [Marinobacter pelagius]|uniref:LTXXQ motif family protein n=2 Tax=Marinobacter pelagius TaxID=379482 RepID=A0A1I4YB62_9GAMM|nr:hypothetical protein SAMN04487961_2875 [Marinobacter pelagius]